MTKAHLVALTLEGHVENPYFKSPIGNNPRNILDVGTGNADWTIEVADMYPSAVVYGIDLFPPPNTMVPPNAVLQVDNLCCRGLSTISLIWCISATFLERLRRLSERTCTSSPRATCYKADGLSKWNRSPTFSLTTTHSPPIRCWVGWGKLFVPAFAASGKAMDTDEVMADRLRAT